MDYKGHDPFDLPNSLFFKLIPFNWYYLQLLVSKFGSRIAPDWLRKLLLVPLIEDPKTYSCSYFSYLLNGEDSNSNEMIKRLLSISKKDEIGIYWGYDFNWPTLDGTTNKKGDSTIVPGSFAMLALSVESILKNDEKLNLQLISSANYYISKHLLYNQFKQPFIGYFKHSISNTHNANLLGCASMTLVFTIFEDKEKLKLLAECAKTSIDEIDETGYIPYKDSKDGMWTDCFHHLYVIASLRMLLELNPYIDKDIYQIKINLLENFYKNTFFREDGLINYYKNNQYPIDPHNYAVTSIYNILFLNNNKFAISLLEKIDSLTWSKNEGRYFHRINKFGKIDKRKFTRWGQVWMLLAFSVVKNEDKLKEIIIQIQQKLTKK